VCGSCGAALPKPAPTTDRQPRTVTDDTFARDVVEASSARPVLVDAWAAWCGPCRMIAPVLDELAAESNGRYTIAKLNVDDEARCFACCACVEQGLARGEHLGIVAGCLDQ